MRLRLSSLALWAFVLGTAFILGAGLYETLVVVPFWADDAPRSLLANNPLLRVQIRAGRFFWSSATPILGLLALAALLTSFGLPRRQMAWRLSATVLLLITTMVTLLYFRPSVINMVVYHGAGQTGDALASAARLWVSLNWLRIAAVAASLCLGLRTLVLPASRRAPEPSLAVSPGLSLRE
ncbi:MAG: DUF1772 domain-containing protein [Candidatus Acidiferrales bacterium]